MTKTKIIHFATRAQLLVNILAVLLIELSFGINNIGVKISVHFFTKTV